jgi:AraC family transcriptional regulator, regulatory protein of adaptative response / methylated-DNA-[protein]-cysteine methyltransferase
MNAIDRARYVTEADRLAAMRARDPVSDGHFVYSVASTGVYCRPVCKARPPKRENIAFHATPEDAERAGFRPCKRCRPDLPPKREREAALIEAACRAIEQAETPPALEKLAAQAGISAFHFHRLFRRVAGVTPKAYADSERARRAQAGLAASASVTETVYDAGFNSAGRFYAAADGMLGMTPGHYRAGGQGERIGFAIGQSELGLVLVARAARGICAILLGDDPALIRAELHARFPRAAITEDAALAADLAQAIAHIEHPAPHFALPLDIRGTAFQRLVWEALRAVPPGETRVYSQIAESLGRPSAIRAVAGACAANPLAVVVPCHRIVAKDGGLAGYRWGISRKRALLAREKG